MGKWPLMLGCVLLTRSCRQQEMQMQRSWVGFVKFYLSEFVAFWLAEERPPMTIRLDHVAMHEVWKSLRSGWRFYWICISAFFKSARHAASSSISFQPSRGNPRQVRDLSEVRPDPPWRSELVFRPHDFAGSAAVPRNGADEAANLFAPTSFASMCHDPTSWVNKYTTYLYNILVQMGWGFWSLMKIRFRQ